MSIFESLEEQKKNKIIQICIQEFAKNGYRLASTNVIAAKAGIAKGSLFQYFGNKEALYFYILDHAAKELFVLMTDSLQAAPNDLIERIIHIARLEFALHLKNPLCLNLFRKAQEDTSSPVYQKVQEKYGNAAENMARSMLNSVNMEKFRFDERVSIDAVLWLLKGFNESFVKKIEDMTNISHIEALYMQELQVYLELLKKGIYIQTIGEEDV